MIYSLKTQRIMTLMLWFVFAGIFLSLIPDYLLWFYAGIDEEFVIKMKYINVVISAINMSFLFFIYFWYIPGPEKRLYIPETRFLLALYMSLFAIGFITGFFNGNDWYYIFGDAFRFLTGLTGFYFMLWIGCGLSRGGRFGVLVSFIEVGVIIALLDALATYVMRYNNPTMKISTYYYFYGILWALFQVRRSLLIAIPVFLFCFGAGLVSGKRGMFIQMAVIIPLYFAYILSVFLINQKKILVMNLLATKIILLSIFLVIVCIAISPVLYGVLDNNSVYVTSTIDLVENVYDIVVLGGGDISFQSRINEWKNVFHYMNNHPESWFLGGGHGVEIEGV